MIAPTLRAGLLYALLGLALYAPCLFLDFHHDDFILLYEASQAHAPADWFALHYYGFINPLMNAFFWVCYRVFGTQPAGYHAAVLAIHVATAALLGFCVQRCSTHAAGVVAACAFLVYQQHFESVTWLAAVREVLLGVPTLACLFCYVWSGRGGGIRPYALALLCCTLALFTKESAYVFPLWLLAAELILTPRSPLLHRVLRLAPFWALTAAIAWWDLHIVIAQRGTTGTSLQVGDVTFYDTASLGSARFYESLVGSLAGTLLPIQWNYLPIDAHLISLGVVALIFGVAVAWAATREQTLEMRMVTFALAWMPLSDLVYAYCVPGAETTQRYTYLPSLGYAALVGWLATRPRRRAWRVLAAALLAAWLGFHAHGLAQRAWAMSRTTRLPHEAQIQRTLQNLDEDGQIYVYNHPLRESYARREVTLYGRVDLSRVHDWYDVLAKRSLGTHDLMLFYDETSDRFEPLTDPLRTMLSTLWQEGWQGGTPPFRPVLLRQWTPGLRTYETSGLNDSIVGPDLELEPLQVAAVFVDCSVSGVAGPAAMLLSWGERPCSVAQPLQPGPQIVRFYPSSNLEWWRRGKIHQLRLIPCTRPARVELRSIQVFGFAGQQGNAGGHRETEGL